MRTPSDIQAWLQSNDDEPDALQIAIWKKMSAPQKLGLAFDMYDFAKITVRSHLQAQHPELTADQVEQIVRQRFTKRE